MLFYLSLVIIIATALTILVRAIKQPPIIAYLLAGVLVGPLFLNLIPSGELAEMFQLFARIGVAFLLFIVGLSLDLRVLKEVGGVASTAGIIEVIITGSIGFIISVNLGFSHVASIYIAAALAFSSTVVVVKILSDKGEIDTLHGRIALGILIIEDIVAALALMIIPMLNSSKNIFSIFLNFGMGVGIILLVFLLSKFLLRNFISYLAKSQETLFLFGIAWALALATVFNSLGFSMEIGALIAGMSLASSKYHFELGSKIRPLRDFFIVLFFVFFGSRLAAGLSWHTVSIALLLSLFILIGKPIIVISVLRWFGYKKRTNFLAASSLAQISEFSLILVLLGFTLGYLSQEALSLIVLVAIFTIFASSYSIYYSHWIFNRLSRFLVFFERNPREEIVITKDYDIILIGYHRMGYRLLEKIKKMRLKVLVIDYNPKVISVLENRKVDCIYGDIGDKEFLRELPLKNIKMIISTAPGFDANVILKGELETVNPQAIFVATAEKPEEAVDLYKEKIDFVLVPHHLGGEYAAHIIEKFVLDKKKYREIGKRHSKELEEGKKKSNYK